MMSVEILALVFVTFFIAGVVKGVFGLGLLEVNWSARPIYVPVSRRIRRARDDRMVKACAQVVH